MIEILCQVSDLLGLLLIFAVWYAGHKQYHLGDYVEGLPEEMESVRFSISSLQLKQAVKSEVASSGHKVGYGDKKWFKITGKF